MKEFTKKDVVRDMYTATEDCADNAGLVAILPLEYLGKQYRKPENQLFRLLGGFGVSPLLNGNACIGYFCADCERCRIEKFEFIGIGNEDVQRIGAELEAVCRNANEH